MTFWDSLGNFLAAINWGDVPSWISVILTVGIGAIAYARRAGIMAWFKRATNAPPSFESQPSWEMKTVVEALELTNHGPGDAFDVRLTIDGRWVSTTWHGQYNFDSIRPGETVILHPTIQAKGSFPEATIYVSWILRHDPGAEPERANRNFTVDLDVFNSAPF